MSTDVTSIPVKNPQLLQTKRSRLQMWMALWNLGPGVFLNALLVSSLKKDREGLDALLSAIEHDLLPDAGPRLSESGKVMLDGDVLALMPDRSNTAVGAGFHPLHVSVAEALAMGLHSHTGADTKNEWRHLEFLGAEDMNFLARVLAVLKEHHSNRQPLKSAIGVLSSSNERPMGSSTLDRFAASIVAHCRDPQAVVMALQACSSPTRAINTRLKMSDINQDQSLMLSDLALSQANPAAINALLDIGEQTPVQACSPRAFLQTESPLNQMVAQMVLSRPGTGVGVNYPLMLRAMRDEFTSGQHKHNSSMTRAVQRLITGAQDASPIFGAIVHSKFLAEVCKAPTLSHEEMALRQTNQTPPDHLEPYSVVFQTIWDMRKVSGVPLSEWYTQAYREAASANFDSVDAVVGALGISVANVAAMNGRHEVLIELIPDLTKRLQDKKAHSTGKGVHYAVGGLLNNACVEMCAYNKPISLDQFRKTVDVLQACGYDHTDTLPHATKDPIGNGASKGNTTLHLMSELIPSDLLLPAMIHVMKMGADPVLKNAKGWTPASALKSKGLDKEWTHAIASHRAQLKAQAALDEIALESVGRASAQP